MTMRVPMLVMWTGCTSADPAVVDSGGAVDAPTMVLGPCSEWSERDRARGPDVEATVRIVWNSDGVTVEIENSHGDISFGLVVTGRDDPDPWTGEDCLLADVDAEGRPVDACHLLPDDESYLWLDAGADPDTIDPATETVFTWEDRFDLTYVLIGKDACLVTGDDYCYYESLDCSVW